MPPAGRRGSNVFVVWDLPVVVFLLSPLFVPVAVLDDSSVVEASLEVCVAVLSPSVEGPSDELWSSVDESSVEVGAERSCEGFGEGASVLPSVCTCGADTVSHSQVVTCIQWASIPLLSRCGTMRSLRRSTAGLSDNDQAVTKGEHSSAEDTICDGRILRWSCR